MNRIEEVFYVVTKRFFPTSTKVELNGDPTLFIFFKVGDNEFNIDKTKVVRMLTVYTMIGGGVFDLYLEEIEELYKLLSLPGNSHNLDFRFMFV